MKIFCAKKKKSIKDNLIATHMHTSLKDKKYYKELADFWKVKSF